MGFLQAGTQAGLIGLQHLLSVVFGKLLNLSLFIRFSTCKTVISPLLGCQDLNYLIRIEYLEQLLLLLFSRSVVSNSLQPYGLQHARFPCHSLSPGVCSNSCPLSLWCHPTIPWSVASSSCPQSFPVSKSFPVPDAYWALSRMFESICYSTLIQGLGHKKQNVNDVFFLPQFIHK